MAMRVYVLAACLLFAGCSGGNADKPRPSLIPTTAPGPTTAWPSDWGTAICGVRDNFDRVNQHVNALVEAAPFHLDRVDAEAEAVSVLTQKITGVLDGLQRWEPGAELARHTRAAIDAMGQGAALIAAASHKSDTATFDAALAKFDVAEREADSASTAAIRLETRYDFTCD